MITNRIFLIAALATTVAASGCASSGETKSTSKGYDVQGCVAGGVTAGAITYFANLGDEDALKKTAIAGALGCMAGAVIGYQVEKRTQEYVDAQQAARDELARNQAETDKLEQYNAQLAQNIDEYKQQISEIQQVNYTEEEKKDKLQQINDIVARQRTKATDTLASVEADIAAATQQFNAYQADATPQDRQQWSTELASYQQEKEILTEYVGELNTLYAAGATI